MADDLALLSQAATAAGEIAKSYFRRDPEVWDKPGDAGPVTEADLAVDRMLRAELLAARPDYGWLSEETEDDARRLGAERVFIVDPIDGTRAFIEGNPTWAISLAIADKGRITEAIVTLPMRGKTYAARLGKGARLNDLPIRTSANESLRQASILAARPTFDAWNWKDASPPPVKPQLRPSLAYRLALVGEGRFDAMLTLRATWEWDIAAGALIVREAGGIASDRRLRPLRFNSPTAQVNGVLAAGRGLYRALGQRLSQS